MGDLEKTIHYTTESEYICRNLIAYIPTDASLVEPFVGQGDLLPLFPTHTWETYDVDAKVIANTHRDTLKEPPDYTGKWIITNPPFLAKNKAQDKTIHNQYGVDDLYKAFLLSILGCKGGIVIVPINFLTDERTKLTREKFLSHFIIDKLNIFTQPVFKTTTYNVCAFAFHEKENRSQTVPVVIFPDKKEKVFYLEHQYGYMIGGEETAIIQRQPALFGRLVEDTPNTKNILNIKLYGLDTRTAPIHLEYNEEHYVGKSTDRVYATFVTDLNIKFDLQQKMVVEFNKQLNDFREKTLGLSLTNYRDFNRKRLGFTFAYKLLTKVYYDLVKEQ